MAQSAVIDIEVERGQTYTEVWQYLDEADVGVPFAGVWHAVMTVGPEGGAPAFTLTDTNGGIALGADGNITFTISSAQTARLDPNAVFVHRLYLVSVADPTVTDPVARGAVLVLR